MIQRAAIATHRSSDSRDAREKIRRRITQSLYPQAEYVHAGGALLSSFAFPTNPVPHSGQVPLVLPVRE